MSLCSTLSVYQKLVSNKRWNWERNYFDQQNRKKYSVSVHQINVKDQFLKRHYAKFQQFFSNYLSKLFSKFLTLRILRSVAQVRREWRMLEVPKIFGCQISNSWFVFQEKPQFCAQGVIFCLQLVRYKEVIQFKSSERM